MRHPAFRDPEELRCKLDDPIALVPVLSLIDEVLLQAREEFERQRGWSLESNVSVSGMWWGP